MSTMGRQKGHHHMPARLNSDSLTPLKRGPISLRAQEPGISRFFRSGILLRIVACVTMLVGLLIVSSL